MCRSSRCAAGPPRTSLQGQKQLLAFHAPGLASVLLLLILSTVLRFTAPFCAHQGLHRYRAGEMWALQVLEPMDLAVRVPCVC